MFCYKCDKIYPGHDVTATIESHPHHDKQTGVDFLGIYVLPDFIGPSEEIDLMTGIDSLPWDISQSGRRKQVNSNFHLFLNAFEILKFISSANLKTNRIWNDQINKKNLLF